MNHMFYKGSVLLTVLAVALPAQRSATVAELVEAIAKAESYCGEAVHEGGEHAPTWLLFKSLRQGATVPELQALLAHASPIVRNYAARGLADRRAPVDWPAVLAARMLDDVLVETVDGCLHGQVRSGDLLFTLARERDLLTADQWLDLGERLVRSDSTLAARAQALRSQRFAAGTRPVLRRLAERGEEAALVALARERHADDLPLLFAALQRPGSFEDAPRFQAAALWADVSLFAPLAALTGSAVAVAVDRTVWELEGWLAAVAAQRSAAAATCLGEFRAAVQKVAAEHRDGLLREQCDAVLAKVLAAHAEVAAFASLREDVRPRR